MITNELEVDYENTTFLWSMHWHNIFLLQQGVQINSYCALILLSFSPQTIR